MTQEDKQILLVDLCARLPYGVRVWYKYATWQEPWFCTSINIPEDTLWLGRKADKVDVKEPIIEADEMLIKPYLRPMSSMTEDERNEIRDYVHRVDVLFVRKHADGRAH